MADQIQESIRHKVLVRAPREQCYDAMATAEGLDSWFTTGATVEAQPGGTIGVADEGTHRHASHHQPAGDMAADEACTPREEDACRCGGGRVHSVRDGRLRADLTEVSGPRPPSARAPFRGHAERCRK